MFVMFALVSTADAGDPLKPYVRRIVIAPDAPRTLSSELPPYLAPLISAGASRNQRVVVIYTEATMMLGSTVLARAELALRE